MTRNPDSTTELDGILPSSEIVWEEPPAKGSCRPRRRAVLETLAVLKEHPGRWALVYEGSQSGAAGLMGSIKRAANAQSERWEATTRRVGDDLTRCYARFLQAVPNSHPREEELPRIPMAGGQ